MAEPSPAYLWYPKDVMSSGRVSSLTALEELWYRRALDQSWLHEGLPSVPKDFAGWVGRGCTVSSAKKIMAMFFEHRLKNSDKVFNKKQEQLRKELRRKSKERSKAGIESGRKRRELKRLADEQLLNKKGTNANISYPSSSPVPKEDFKRLILRVREEFPKVDGRIVEIGMLYTMLQRNGSDDPIRSTKYFHPEIKKVMRDSKGMKEKGITSLLYVRRSQVWKEQGWEWEEGIDDQTEKV